MPDVVLTFYDHTGIAVWPWAERGYECHAYDILNEDNVLSGVHMHRADLYDPHCLDAIRQRFAGAHVAFCFAFPPCTDLSIVGARWWARKKEKNESFQAQAVNRVLAICHLIETFRCRYVIENPYRSMLNKLWRRCDLFFDPCDYGGYLDKDDTHPVYGDIWPKRDAYTKRTGLWTSLGLELPPKKPVDPDWYYFVKDRGKPSERICRMSPLFSSWYNKHIRNATPRGWAVAMAETYASADAGHR